MCNVCGCGEGESRLEGHPMDHAHDYHAQGHGHPHAHADDLQHDYGQGPAHAHAPGMSQARMVQVEQDILSKNAAYAAQNRGFFLERGVLVLNLVSSPGSGKTTLLTETIARLKQELALAVIEGDQQTNQDAERIRTTGVSALQINTGKGCHLDAHMIGHALTPLGIEDQSVLFIENVGNLVCPAAFDLGEAHKVVILSVTEGEDKPLKYPDMFHAADLVLLNKVDLLPYVQFDVDRCIEYAHRVNGELETLEISATTGVGMDAWCQWILQRRQRVIATQVGRLEERLARSRSELTSA
jgi:hydrogenase nickel incorporation protein HypB